MISKSVHSVSICLMALFLVGCSGGSDDPPDSLAGFWFICESETSASCGVFDDDGIELTDSGDIFRIQESSQGSLEACGGSPCFSASSPQISVVRSEEIGSYTYNGVLLRVSFNFCNEEITPRINDDEIVLLDFLDCDNDFDGSSASNGSVLSQYDGIVNLVN